jgi:hypothetical protein
MIWHRRCSSRRQHGWRQPSAQGFGTGRIGADLDSFDASLRWHRKLDELDEKVEFRVTLSSTELVEQMYQRQDEFAPLLLISAPPRMAPTIS